MRSPKILVNKCKQYFYHQPLEPAGSAARKHPCILSGGHRLTGHVIINCGGYSAISLSNDWFQGVFGTGSQKSILSRYVAV